MPLKYSVQIPIIGYKKIINIDANTPEDALTIAKALPGFEHFGYDWKNATAELQVEKPTVLEQRQQKVAINRERGRTNRKAKYEYKTERLAKTE